MSKPLPSTVDAHKLAHQGICLGSDLVLSDMSRLIESLADDFGQMSIELKFEIADDNLHYVHGHFQGELQILCQRCMDPMPLTIDSKFVLGLMDNPEIAERLPESIDPVYLEEGELDLAEMIEDELILLLPLIAKHELNDCSAVEHMQDKNNLSGDAAIEAKQAASPFAVLKDLIK